MAAMDQNSVVDAALASGKDVVDAVPPKLVRALFAKWGQDAKLPVASLQENGSTMVHIDSYRVRQLTKTFIEGGRVILPIAEEDS